MAKYCFSSKTSFWRFFQSEQHLNMKSSEKLCRPLYQEKDELWANLVDIFIFEKLTGAAQTIFLKNTAIFRILSHFLLLNSLRTLIYIISIFANDFLLTPKFQTLNLCVRGWGAALNIIGNHNSTPNAQHKISYLPRT